ncbi:MAG: hypothetical protein KDE28_22975 [Anaerolineales bacterium]|nr:hypothetical protein [Anaerolineales bacterium]
MMKIIRSHRVSYCGAGHRVSAPSLPQSNIYPTLSGYTSSRLLEKQETDSLVALFCANL